jgi:aspartyl-tRNA(Asn)/glutamyl-tRNA(Gln) amidotransferase subunit C
LTSNIYPWEYQFMEIDDLRETAGLAHLNLDDEELAGAFPAFEQMLGFFAAMQAADEDAGAFRVRISPAGSEKALDPFAGTAGVETSRTAGAGHFRPDIPSPSNPCHTNSHNPEDRTLNLLNNAGERDGRFIVVPNVL